MIIGSNYKTSIYFFRDFDVELQIIAAIKNGLRIQGSAF